jgi:hypothetical protein
LADDRGGGFVTATELLAADAVFATWLRWWEENHYCPLELADWCGDHGHDELMPKRRETPPPLLDCPFNNYPPSRAVGLQWLSDAAVAFGRQCANLSPLTEVASGSLERG